MSLCQAVTPHSAMKLHLLFVVSFTWAMQEVPTYFHRDPVTSEVFQCDQCPPGTAVQHHCGPRVPTHCVPCPAHHFSEQWHWGDSCQHCTAVCKEKQLVVQECNSTHNRLCECEPGYHLEVEFCIRHTVCRPGYGATLLGTPVSDTACEKCPEGSFSSTASATEPCIPHRNCSALGLGTARPGSDTQDSVCDCIHQHLQCHTEFTLCEEAVFQFLASHRLSPSQFEMLTESLPGRKVDRKSVEQVKTTCQPNQQILKLLLLWREQNKDQDKNFSIIRGMNVCERKVSRCASLKNLTLSDLKVVMESLPGTRVHEEDIREVVDSCPSQQYILQLLHLWKTQNSERDIAKGLAQGLRRLRGQRVPPHVVKSMRRISRIFSSTSLLRMHEKMFFSMIQESKCFQGKSYND